MTGAQIKCFLASVESGSFSRAAERMFISQPAVSKQVSQLEAELGFPLFQRTSGGLRVTRAGALMYNFYIDQQHAQDAVVEDARRLSGAQGSHIRLGCLGGWNMTLFYPQLKQYLADQGLDMTLTVSGLHFTEMPEALKSGRVDVIMSLYSSLLDHPEIPSLRLTTTGGILAFSASHPLAGKPGLSVADFAGETIFTIVEPEGYRNTSRHVRQCCARYGFDPTIINLSSLSEVLVKVQSCEGVIFVDDWMLAGYCSCFRTIHTDDVFEIGLGWLDDGNNPDKKVFADAFAAYFRLRNSGQQ